MQIKSKSGRVFDIPDEEETKKIHRGIALDPDTCTLDEFKKMRPVGRPKAAVTKQPVSIRLSPDVIEYFKEMSEEVDIPYQSLINFYLMDCMRSHRRIKFV